MSAGLGSKLDKPTPPLTCLLTHIFLSTNLKNLHIYKFLDIMLKIYQKGNLWHC